MSLVSCEEQNPPLFGDITGVYFNNREKGVVVDNEAVTFVYVDSETMDVPVTVQLMGRLSDEDREVSITVTSEDAVKGEDYDIPASAVLPAGASSFEYTVTLTNTASLKQETKTIDLEIHENGNFGLLVTELEQASGKVSLVKFRIVFSDQFSEPPVAWDKNILGEFSQQKFELIIKELGISRSDFNNPEKMQISRQSYISETMTEYVNDQLALFESTGSCDMDIFVDKDNPSADNVLIFKKTANE